MSDSQPKSALILGVFLLLGLGLFAYLLGHAGLRMKALDRIVSVKGLSEREVEADVAVWSIRFQDTGNDLPTLFDSLQAKNGLIAAFLARHGLKSEDVTTDPPAVRDLQAQSFGDKKNAAFRFAGWSTTTVHSQDIAAVRRAMADTIELGKRGIALSGEDYGHHTEFLFTRLNEIKPTMIAEATLNARAVAQKFAADSHSAVGKIKQASQGQFTIEDRDSTTPYIKRVRVVSTVEYYLSD